MDCDCIGGAIAGSDRTFDGSGQPRICPITGKHKVPPLCLRARPPGVLCRRCRKRCAPLPHDLPRRQRGRQAGDARYVAPNRFGKLVPRGVDKRVAGADGDGDAAGKRKDPLHRAVKYTDDWGRPGRRLDAEMRVDNGAKFRRHFEAAHQGSRSVRWYCQDNGVVACEHDRFLAEIERLHPVGGKAQGAQLVLEANGRAALLQRLQHRLDQCRAQSVARDERPAGPPTSSDGFPDYRARELCRSVRRIDVERRQQQRLDETLIQRSFARDNLADGFAARRP